MTVTHNEHAESGHHEAPEVVDGRQRLGIWLFIGGDMISLGALLFTYLYLRGVNSGGHWMSIVGMPSKGITSAGPDTFTPTTLVEQPMANGLNWLIVLVVVVSAALMWLGEKRLRASVNGRGAFRGYAAAATVTAVVAIVLQVMQVRNVPQYWIQSNDSALFAYTSYGSVVLAFGISAIIHFVLLVLLGAGLYVRAGRNVLSYEKWYQARLVRFFWVWIAVSTIVSAIVVTLLNTVH